MTVRLYNEDDKSKLSAEGQSKELHSFGENIERWLKKGLTRPEFAFVFDDNAALIGGMAFNVFEAGELDVMDFVIDMAKLDQGARLLRRCLELAGSGSFESVAYNLYCDNGRETYENISRIFIEAGFCAVQEKKSYSYNTETPLSGDSRGVLSFEGIGLTDADKFAEAVELVTVGTLDTGMAGDVKRLGGQRAALDYIEGLKSMDYRPDWWLLAYDAEGLAGLVIPQKFSETAGAINYIGVTPEKRGKGYVLELLHRGTEILINDGVKKIIADIDVGNYPMEDALKAIGYEFLYDETVFELRP
jgi:hypothetical protein